MGPWSRVRVAKCQMLVTSLFVLLLGLAMATTAVLTYFGPHFAVIGHASSQRTRYEALHLWAFSTGITLAALLILGAVMSAAATVREAGGLMAGAFLCFALVFCALVQVAFWRCHNPTQVEDAVLDAYDQVYEQTVKSSSVIWRQELVAIQDMFQCCGLPAGDQERPEDAWGHRLHPDQPRPRLHGVRDVAQRLPLVCHPLGQIHPEPTVGPPAPPHLPRGVLQPCSWRRAGREHAPPTPLPRCLPLPSKWDPWTAGQASSPEEVLWGRLGPLREGQRALHPAAPILAETWPHSCQLHRHRETVLWGPRPGPPTNREQGGPGPSSRAAPHHPSALTASLPATSFTP